ncbi:MAG: hypothetical protein KC583_06595, partial [Myxococcales bacterium]|nr:hypothetical protein [Myxococcales bacterium]
PVRTGRRAYPHHLLGGRPNAGIRVIQETLEHRPLAPAHLTVHRQAAFHVAQLLAVRQLVRSEQGTLPADVPPTTTT